MTYIKSIQKGGQNGYIALMSAIIITAVLTTIIFALSFSGFMTRANLADTEYKRMSFNLAEACTSTAILKKAQNPTTYIGNETLTINGRTCTIRLIAADWSTCNTSCLIETRSVVQGATTNLSITVNNTTFAVTRWQELTNF